MPAITTTKLTMAQTVVMQKFAQPGLGGAPLLDLIVRLGACEEIKGAVYNIPFMSARQASQQVASYGQWTTATSDIIKGFSAVLYDSYMTPCKFDARHLSGADEEIGAAMKKAIEAGYSEFSYALNYDMFNNANFDGGSETYPFAGFKNALPFAATGTYYGMNRATYTVCQHYYSNASVSGGGAAGTTAEFWAPTSHDGFIDRLSEAITKATIKGAQKMVLFVDATTYGFFKEYYRNLGGVTPTTTTPGWIPATATQAGLTVGSLGYSVLTFDDVLVVPTDGIDTTVANGYLVPFSVRGQANVVWAYANQKRIGKISGQWAPVYATEFRPSDRSQTFEAGIFTSSAIILRDLSVCAAIKHSGTFKES